MKKTVIIAAATAVTAIAAFVLFRRNRQNKLAYSPAPQKRGNEAKHITSVFSHAKKVGL